MRQFPFSPPENTLLPLLKARNCRGFSLLYQLYGPNLYGIALRIVRSPAVAEDVLQETMVKVWRKIDSYDPAKGSLFTWLLNIVRNTALDQLRADQALLSSAHVELEEYVSSGGRQVSSEVFTDHIGLDEVLISLTQEHQRIIDYLYFRGHTQAEAAKALNMPLGTVKTKLRMALSQLRRSLLSEAEACSVCR